MATSLMGHSGCSLELRSLKGENIVIKKAENYEYNKRLEAQCDKQLRYKENIFKAVKVIDKGYDEQGLFWFSMEYINGFTVADYMQGMELMDIKKLSDQFLSVVVHDHFDDKEARKVFFSKIDDLKNTIKIKNEIIEKSLKKLAEYKWDHVTSSVCHGDLTLENIIISEGNLYLIDFLDSFYDSWQIDIAKILQDVELFWHYRKERIDNNLFIRLLLVKNLIITKLLGLENGEKIVETIYHILLLNLLRIIPYTKDEMTFNFLWNGLNYINEKIDVSGWRDTL